MASEDEFQDALDAQPDDHVCRMIFADWLEEQGDPRAEGYRAMGRRGHWSEVYFWCNAAEYESGDPEDLPADWFHAIRWRRAVERCSSGCWWLRFDSRREADDEAALAFAKLPAERRAELLAGTGA